METPANCQPITIPFARMISLALVALLVTFTIAKWINVGQSFQTPNQEKEKLSISAEGKIEATPDIAIINLGVLTEGKDSKTVKDENSKKINAIIEALGKQGIEKKDMKTLQLDLQPKYDWSNGKSTLSGYTLRQQLEVKVRDISKAGDVFSEAANLGSNEISNIRYDFSNPEDLKQEARKLALDNAKIKAEELATTAGIKLGKLINFYENNVYVPYASYDYGGLGMEKVETVNAVAPNLQSGSKEIIANISVTYEIK